MRAQAQRNRRSRTLGGSAGCSALTVTRRSRLAGTLARRDGASPPASRTAFPPPVASGFTLIETLVVVAVIAILLSILLPALGAVRGSAKSLVCASNLKSVTVEFAMFADGTGGTGRGDSEKLGPTRFQINDFQESLYRIAEFWDRPGADADTLRSDANVLLCPAGPATLTRRSGFPCSSAAIGEPEGVTTAFNMRLYRASVDFKGKRVLAPSASTFVRADVLGHSFVPLAFDVDGEEAQRRSIEPFYSAPAIRDVEDSYATGAYWMPSTRHRGRTNVAFVGGHVLTSETPATERWDWGYQASAGR